jgi:hypothetical protein
LCEWVSIVKPFCYHDLVGFPKHVQDLLWEYDLEDPRSQDRLDRVIVERVMERGGWESMRWLLETYPRSELIEFLETRGRRVLPPRELRFWSWASGVPDAVATSWVHEARHRAEKWPA